MDGAKKYNRVDAQYGQSGGYECALSCHFLIKKKVEEKKQIQFLIL